MIWERLPVPVEIPQTQCSIHLVFTQRHERAKEKVKAACPSVSSDMSLGHVSPDMPPQSRVHLSCIHIARNALGASSINLISCFDNRESGI